LADQFNHDIDGGRPPLAARKSYSGVFGIVAALAIIAGVSGLLWLNYDHLVEASSHTGAVASSASGEDPTALRELQAIQQQTADTLLATRQLLEAQQAEVKLLSEQVSGLTAKIDQLQPRAAAPPPAPPTVAATRPAPKKPPAAPKPAGAISVGGAPLPAPAQPAR
jgi:uncharacterized coiled-coil protein SlyX